MYEDNTCQLESCLRGFCETLHHWIKASIMYKQVNTAVKHIVQVTDHSMGCPVKTAGLRSTTTLTRLSNPQHIMHAQTTSPSTDPEHHSPTHLTAHGTYLLPLWVSGVMGSKSYCERSSPMIGADTKRAGPLYQPSHNQLQPVLRNRPTFVVTFPW